MKTSSANNIHKRGQAWIFREKAELLDWQIPKEKEIKRTDNKKFTIVFPSSTVGRKGCYELREAIRGLDVIVNHARRRHRRHGFEPTKVGTPNA